MQPEFERIKTKVTSFIIYLQSECMEKYQPVLYSKYDREHYFELILRKSYFVTR